MASSTALIILILLSVAAAQPVLSHEASVSVVRVNGHLVCSESSNQTPKAIPRANITMSCNTGIGTITSTSVTNYSGFYNITLNNENNKTPPLCRVSVSVTVSNPIANQKVALPQANGHHHQPKNGAIVECKTGRPCSLTLRGPFKSCSSLTSTYGELKEAAATTYNPTPNLWSQEDFSFDIFRLFGEYVNMNILVIPVFL